MNRITPSVPAHDLSMRGVLTRGTDWRSWQVTMLFGGAPAIAASMSEHFNDYGPSAVALNGLNGGSGWPGAWSSSGSAPIYVSLSAGDANNLSYPYDNTGNEANASAAGADGAAGDNGGTLTDRAIRSVGSLDGTLWISALVRYDSPTDDVNIWLDSADLIGIQDQQAVLDYGSSVDIEGTGADDDDVAGVDPVFAVDTTHLLLLKVVFNSPSLTDSYSFWVNPPLDGTEGGLGLPLFSRTGINALGGALTNVGIAFSGSGGRVDSIRLSNDPDGLTDVAAVPGPATGWLLMTGLALLATRRKPRPTSARCEISGYQLRSAAGTVRHSSFESKRRFPIPSPREDLLAGLHRVAIRGCSADTVASAPVWSLKPILAVVWLPICDLMQNYRCHTSQGRKPSE